eukprot:7157825-Prymnesium_polylepis.1
MIRAPAHRPPELRSRPTSARRARMKTVWRRDRRRALRKGPRQRGNRPRRPDEETGGRREDAPHPAEESVTADDGSRACTAEPRGSIWRSCCGRTG